MMSVDPSVKRKESGDEEDEEVVGPQMEEMMAHRKKRKVVEYEKVYLENLASSEAYEKSFMHREIVSHILMSPKTDFLVTASTDGRVKFWKKLPEGIEFVKDIKTHMGNIQDMSCDSSGSFLCTISNDCNLKIFDVINFDMINKMKLEYSPQCCQWVFGSGDAIPAIAVSQQDSSDINVYDAKGSSEPLHTLSRLHTSPVILMRFNPSYATMVSVDTKGMLEYWSSPSYDYKFPEDRVDFDSKLDTDLYEFVKHKVTIHDLSFSPDGTHFAVISSDRKIRLFKFSTGKMLRVFDETLQQLTSLQKMKQVLSNVEFSRRMAVENELEKSEFFSLQRITFDKSGYFILYPNMLGIKVVNWVTNRCHRILGKSENLRPLGICVYQDIPNRPKATLTAEMQAADNPNLENCRMDPSVFTTAFKKNRFYIFSRRDPDDSSSASAGDRDVFNERPTREDILAATDAPIEEKLFDTCCIHTSMGDITCRLFVKETPKTVENFCVHSKNGYYRNHIFHRVIKQFMIQTGDPTGTGTGGESIWGPAGFEDEFHPNLKQDKPYLLCMANSGPNSNGSQFFITVIPCPWLNGKHTIFGQVIQGMEVVQNISNVKTNRKTDKPFDDIKIISITLK